MHSESSSSRFKRLRPLALFAGSAAVIVLMAAWLLRPASFDNLRIRGSHRFKAQVVKALEALRTKAPDAYQTVTNNIGAIAQSKHSGMAVYRKPPTFELNDATAFYSVTWCAGCIAHDSLHARYYFTWARLHAPGQVVPHDVWMGEASETLCMEYQLRVLRQIGAPSNEIAHCLASRTNRYWDVDYKKRNW